MIIRNYIPPDLLNKLELIVDVECYKESEIDDITIYFKSSSDTILLDDFSLINEWIEICIINFDDVKYKLIPNIIYKVTLGLMNDGTYDNPDKYFEVIRIDKA